LPIRSARSSRRASPILREHDRNVARHRGTIQRKWLELLNEAAPQVSRIAYTLEPREHQQRFVVGCNAGARAEAQPCTPISRAARS
jgi:hypothetical protein